MTKSCKGCGAAIEFILTKDGGWTPIDAKPEKRWVCDREREGWRLLDTYISHFATCPKGDTFRKKKGKTNE